MTLRPCSHCQCHVSSEEALCPFCDGALASPVRRHGAVAAAVIGGLAVAMSGCGETATPVYGIPPVDSAMTDSGPGPSPAYGIAPGDDGGETADAGASIDASAADTGE